MNTWQNEEYSHRGTGTERDISSQKQQMFETLPGNGDEFKLMLFKQPRFDFSLIAKSKETLCVISLPSSWKELLRCSWCQKPTAILFREKIQRTSSPAPQQEAYTQVSDYFQGKGRIVSAITLLGMLDQLLLVSQSLYVEQSQICFQWVCRKCWAWELAAASFKSRFPDR